MSTITDTVESPAHEEIHDTLKDILRRNNDGLKVRLADSLVSFYDKQLRPLIFDQGELRRYDQELGIYEVVENSEVFNAIYNLNGLQNRDGKSFDANPAFSKAVLSIIQSRSSDKDFFLNPIDGLAVKNGFILVKDNNVELVPHSPDYRQTATLPIPYVKDVATDIIDDFMHDTFKNKEITDLIYEISGTALFGYGARHQKIIIFHGEGANGKGVILELLEQLIPIEMRSAVPPSEWHTEYLRYPLVGSRLNTVGEMPNAKDIRFEPLKAICAGDSYSFRNIGGKAFMYKPKALHIFATNPLHRLAETGEAIQRRFLVVPFKHIVPENKRRPNYAKELFELQALGLLSRSIEGFQRVLKQDGYSSPLPVRIATKYWLNRTSCEKLFAEEMLLNTSNSKDRISSTELFNHCCRFADEHDVTRPSSHKDFTVSLKRLGYENKKSNGLMVWPYVKLKE
ncbi:MAG: hypothetical protein HQL69_19765 [Magnetococcales bacterium]|nr:hypothetical protein [Magnetococcales bacterium]